MEVVWYGTSGGMHISFGALLIPEDANIKYVRNIIVEEKPADEFLDEQQFWVIHSHQ